MESDDDDHLEFKQITLNRDEKVKGCEDAIEASMLEESFSAYQDAYVESPFRPCNVLSATQRRAEMKQRLPLFGPSNEATFSVPEDCPGIYFKRFSSDGRFLYGFGNDSKFYIYQTCYSGRLGSETTTTPKFTDFIHQQEIEVDLGLALNGGGRTASFLCRDFCLTIKDPVSGQDSHVLIAASLPANVSQVNGKSAASFMVRKDGSVEYVPNCSSFILPFLDHISFFLVSLKCFKVVDYVTFKYDYVYLAHHLGVGLYEGNGSVLFSVLSLKNQIISQFQIEGDSFCLLGRVQHRHFNDVEVEVNLAGSAVVCDQLDASDAVEDVGFGRRGVPTRVGLLHSLCEFLPPAGRNDKLLSSLHIWKHQALGANLLLLRLASASVILGTAPRNQSAIHILDPLPSTNQVSFLVLYDSAAKRVLRCFNSADPRLVDWIKSSWTMLRGPAHDFESFDISLDLLARHLSKISSSNDDDPTSSMSIIRRVTNTIPLSPQQFACSPLLDSRIVRWDARLTTILSRMAPLNCTFFSSSDAVNNSLGLMNVSYGQEQVRFFSRAHPYEQAFTLNFTPTPQAQIDSSSVHLEKHRWCSLILHPTLPLILIYQYSIFRSTSIRVFYR